MRRTVTKKATARLMEPFMMSILSNRFSTITREAGNALLRSARSGILNMAKDFSCAITDADAKLIMASEGLPVHLGNIQLIPKAVLELFGDDIKPGDRFINNCGYYGNIHHSDHTISAPVFYKDKLVFFAVTRAHVADTGIPIPTGYSVWSKDIYEEGLHLPCVRIQRDYADIPDIIRICKVKIRNPEVWYGDYLGVIGSVNLSETRLIELCDKYGIDTIKAFLSEWQEYGKKRMMAELSKLPKGTWSAEARHDAVEPVTELFPDGIPVRVKMTTEPEEGSITIDVRDNIDNIPCGFNLTEGSVQAACIVGVMNVLDPTLPHNEGTFSRIKVLMREGSVIGKPQFPAATACASNNMAHLVINLVQSMFARFCADRGVAHGAYAVRYPCLKGIDWRHNNAPFTDQLVFPVLGGPAAYKHDGWLTYGSPSMAGAMLDPGIEVTELKFPVIFDRVEIIPDSGGAGQWNGAPGSEVIHGMRHDPCQWLITGGGHDFPPAGVKGGEPGRPMYVYKFEVGKKKKSWVTLPPVCNTVAQPGEMYVIQSMGGGGYGDPLERDPEMVRKDVLKEYITLEKARQTYGIVLDTRPEQYAVSYSATAKLRSQLRLKKGGK